MANDLDMASIIDAMRELDASTKKTTVAFLDLNAALRWWKRQQRRAYAMKVVNWRRGTLRRTGRWPA